MSGASRKRARQRLTYKGDRFLTVGSVCAAICAGEFIYIGDKPVSPLWARNMTISRLGQLVGCGQVYRCMDARDTMPWPYYIYDSVRREKGDKR